MLEQFWVVVRENHNNFRDIFKLKETLTSSTAVNSFLCSFWICLYGLNRSTNKIYCWSVNGRITMVWNIYWHEFYSAHFLITQLVLETMWASANWMTPWLFGEAEFVCFSLNPEDDRKRWISDHTHCYRHLAISENNGTCLS